MEALVLKRSVVLHISLCDHFSELTLPTITGHAGLAGNTSGDDNNLGALQGFGKTGGSGLMAGDLLCVSGVARVRFGLCVVPRSWC
jgi:hypothetical protein